MEVKELREQSRKGIVSVTGEFCMVKRVTEKGSYRGTKSVPGDIATERD